jgi:SPP1 gp7 family putative phage head morphogenesis protein
LGWPVISTGNSEFSKGLLLSLTPGARVNSTFAGHYDLAVYLVMIITVVLAVFIGWKSMMLRIYLCFIGGLSTVVLVMTAARLSLLAVLFGVISVIILGKKWKYLLVLMVLSVVVVAYPSQLRDRFVSTLKVNVLDQGTRYEASTVDQDERSTLNIPTLPMKIAIQSAENVEIEQLTATESATASAKVASDIVPGEPIDSTQLGVFRSLQIRTQIEWPRALNAFYKNPLIGTGYSSLGIATDNDILRSLGEVGLMGTIVFSLLHIEILRRFFRQLKSRNKLTKFLSIGLIGVIVAFVVNSTFIDVYEASKIATFFWMILGILGFRDPIPDADWERMKKDVEERYGGTERRLMMLRGMGDGVQWLPTAMSQADMQFLDGRTFTKEEIFAIYAPGLSSMLAVNATEANSVSGKRTFVEYGVWPHLVRVAEKITNDLLPMYGPDLVGEFDDIRVTDKQMELAEIAAYSQTHTVDEVRAKYYGDEELGDDRGNLLVTEVGKGLTPADPNPEPPPAPIMLPPNSPAAAPNAASQPAQPEEPDDDDMEDMPNGEMQAEGQRGQGERQAEVKALRRWLRNRKHPDPLKFRRVHLSEGEVLDIAGDMRSEGEADTDQPPFTMDGSNTRDDWTAALKAMVLQLDPGEDDAAERVITELERRGETTILRAFREQWQNLLPPNAENMELGELMAYVNSRLLTAQPTVDAIARTLYDAAGAGVNIALDQLERIGVGFDYTLVNTRAQDWAKRYSYELIQGINDTTKQAVQQAVERWYGNGEPLSALIDDLQPAFSKKRARLIAATETTRASAQGNLLGYKESGVVTGLVFKTAKDEHVCAFCGGLDGKIVSIEGGSFYDELTPELQSKLKRRFDVPPVHPNCRCRISAQVLTPEDAQRQARGGI